MRVRTPCWTGSRLRAGRGRCLFLASSCLAAASYTKLVDRFKIGPLTLIQYDLKQHKVMHSIDWPEKAEPECGRILFSPDGELLYLFSEDILIYETSELKQVDTWEISRPVEEGMGRLHDTRASSPPIRSSSRASVPKAHG